jgi:hypothetical protein
VGGLQLRLRRWVVGVEAQGAEAQFGRLAQQVEELSRVQAEVAVVDVELAVGIGGCGQGRGLAVQLVLDALALGLGGMQGAADVLAGVLVAKVADRQAAGLAADVVAAPGPPGVLRGGRVVQRALQAALEVAHELLKLAHDAGQGRLLGGGRVSRFGVAGSSVSLQQGHWGAVAGCGHGGGQCGRQALGGRATAAQGEMGGVAQGRAGREVPAGRRPLAVGGWRLAVGGWRQGAARRGTRNPGTTSSLGRMGSRAGAGAEAGAVSYCVLWQGQGKGCRHGCSCSCSSSCSRRS